MIDYISYSSMGVFAQSPQLFYRTYITKELPRLNTKSTRFGSALDCYCLSYEDFNDKYEVESVKSIEGKTGLFLEKYAETNNLDKAYEYAGFEIGKKRVELLLDKPENKIYLEHLKKPKKETNKTIITKSEYDTIVKMDSALRTNIFTKEIYEPELFAEYYIQHEGSFQFNGFKIVYRIDKITLDTTKKEIIVDDLKTTGKLLDNFKDSYELYNYDIQAAVYTLGIYNELITKQGIFEKNSDFNEIKFRFITIEKQEPYRSCFFNVGDDERERAGKRLIELTNDLKWHLETNNWLYKKHFYDTNGKILL